jgi:integrase
MAALKWEKVDFKKEIIRVRETLVKGITTPPKTKRSSRDVDILPPVLDALKDQKKETFGKSEYVFINQYGKTVDPMSMNFHVWKPAL